MKKLKSNKGESILETLVALTIIVLSIAFLTGSIISANKIMNTSKKYSEGFKIDPNTDGKFTASLSCDQAGIMENRPVTGYSHQYADGKAYFYYYEP